ncbi:MAG: M23 family metallopeptidase, partial [Nitrospirota bacterium]|nr:M23 family metallopeptidase [Nitrospirota bacterium]
PDPEHLLTVVENDGAYTASMERLVVTVKPAVHSGTVVSSLYASLAAAGVEQDMAREFVDIFAWEIDFSSDLRPGAEWRILYEEKWRDGKVQGIGRLAMAELVNGGRESAAIWYEAAPGKGAYYSPEGNSIRRQFLRAPVDKRQGTASVPVRGSGSGNSVEYGALPGTPVLATADGRVSSLGSIKGRGRTLTLRHEGGYITQYTHLGSFGKGISKGGRVQQGAVVGYVGSAKKGRSYIVFSVQKGGKAIDPLKLPNLPALRLSSKDMKVFKDYLQEKTIFLHQPRPDHSQVQGSPKESSGR